MTKTLIATIPEDPRQRLAEDLRLLEFRRRLTESVKRNRTILDRLRDE